MNQGPFFWILDDMGAPRRVKGVEAWIAGMSTLGRLRVVDRTEVGETVVSTVFIGHPSICGRAPELWETALLGRRGRLVVVDRCNGAREQAEAMHAAHVARMEAKAAAFLSPHKTNPTKT